MKRLTTKTLTLLGLSLASGMAHAGVLGQLNVGTKIAALIATQGNQISPKLRVLGGTFTSVPSEPLLIQPSLPFGMREKAPNSDHAPAVGGRSSFRAIALPAQSTTSDAKPIHIAPGTKVGSTSISVAPNTSAATGMRPINTAFETALPLLEALFMIPMDRRSAIPITSNPLIRPLPAIEMKGTKPIGGNKGSDAAFEDTKPVAPGLGNSVTEQGAPIIIIDPKIKSTQDTKVSVVANSVDLNRVLSILSEQTKANLVLLAPVDTKLTVRLQGVKFIDALRHICTLAGLDFVTAKGAYILGPADKLKTGYPDEWKTQHPEVNNGKIEPIVTVPPPVDPPKDPIIARTISTNYVDAQSMADSIKALLGEGVLQVATGPSQLSPSIVDRDTQQATGVAQGVIQTDGRPVSRTLIVRGPKSLVNDALQIVKDLDLPRAQVAISVTIHDITDTALKELGVAWELGGFTINETPSSGGVNVGRFTRTGTSFAAALKGMEQTDKAKLLASPSVRVMDRERAFVLIGSRLKFPVVSSYSTTGVPIVTTQEEKVGVYLQVAPQISSDKSITLTLYPQVSTVVSYVQIGGGSYPQIDSREAQTTLRVQSGETIVIGGLYKDEELSKITQIPILAQLPIIGELFKNRKKTKTASQVIITLAIELVEPE